jgi:hypothetical protein
MARPETSFEEERREVWDSVLECLDQQPGRDGLAACSFLLCHLAGYHEPKERGLWKPAPPPHQSGYRPSGRLP